MLHLPKRAPFVFAAAFTVATARPAAAQSTQGGFSTGPQTWQMGPPQPAPYYGPQPGSSTSQDATDLELGTLYAMAAGYGVGTGIWIDAEAGIDDPGLKFLAPAILGVGA